VHTHAYILTQCSHACLHTYIQHAFAHAKLFSCTVHTCMCVHRPVCVYTPSRVCAYTHAHDITCYLCVHTNAHLSTHMSLRKLCPTRGQSPCKQDSATASQQCGEFEPPLSHGNHCPVLYKSLNHLHVYELLIAESALPKGPGSWLMNWKL
jgi:hypothetical protein